MGRDVPHQVLHWNDWADDAVYPDEDVAVLARQGRPWTVKFMR
jgi:hypothetical protein